MRESICRRKDAAHGNAELAVPDDFAPRLPDGPERSAFIARQGRVDFVHDDHRARALAKKIERRHTGDRWPEARTRDDLRGLVGSPGILQLVDRVEPESQRYPPADADRFRRGVEEEFESMPRDA